MPGPSDSAAAKPAGGQGKPDKVESEAGGELDEFAPAEHLEDGSLAVLAFDLDNPGPDMYRTVTILESLGSPPGDCTLGLRGMKFVNAQLEGKGHRLAADWQGAEKGLAVLLEISGTSAEFGRFWFAGNALQFRWSKRLGDKERATLRWLSACVVEVRSDRTLRRVALCQTYSMESVPLRKEEDRVVVPVDFSAPGLSRGRNPFPAQAFPLRLWRGKVLFEEMEYLFGFGDARGSSPPYVIAGLAEKVGADQVRINMEPGKEAESGVWRLLIRPIVKVPGSKLIGEVEKKQKRLVALTRRLSVVLSPRLGMAQRMEALRQLAEVLEKPAPRTYPRLDPRLLGALNGKERRDAQEKHLRELLQWNLEVEEQIVTPAKEEQKQLVSDIKEIRDRAEKEVTEYQRKIQENQLPKVLEKLGRVKRVSAILFRLVDDQFPSVEVVVGKP